jgi:ankyrin repeat protein
MDFNTTNHIPTQDELNNQLLNAAEDGDIDTINTLLEQGANIEAKDNNGLTALMLAAQEGYTDTINALLERGANINEHNDGKTVLMFAAENGHTHIVETLLQQGADTEIPDNEENEGYWDYWFWTALMFAADKGHTDTVKALLNAKANIEAKSPNDWTPLMLAASHGHTDTVDLLLQHGADIEATNCFDENALTTAAENGHTHTVDFLLTKKANIEAITDKNTTALMLATERGYITTVKALLKHGANIEAKNNQNENAFDIAINKKNKSLICIFSEYTKQNEKNKLTKTIEALIPTEKTRCAFIDLPLEIQAKILTPCFPDWFEDAVEENITKILQKTEIKEKIKAHEQNKHELIKAAQPITFIGGMRRRAIENTPPNENNHEKIGAAPLSR